MPVTPFHFGIGVLGKGAAPGRFSLLAFVASQVVIDCETAYYIMTRQWPLHRWCHTLVVAVPLGIAVGLAVWAAAGVSRRRVSLILPPGELDLVPAIIGGALGGLTHPILDGIMHTDVMPLRPFSDRNPLLGWIGLAELHLLCVLAGVAGLVMLSVRRSA